MHPFLRSRRRDALLHLHRLGGVDFAGGSPGEAASPRLLHRSSTSRRCRGAPFIAAQALQRADLRPRSGRTLRSTVSSSVTCCTICGCSWFFMGARPGACSLRSGVRSHRCCARRGCAARFPRWSARAGPRRSLPRRSSMLSPGRSDRRLPGRDAPRMGGSIAWRWHACSRRTGSGGNPVVTAIFRNCALAGLRFCVAVGFAAGKCVQALSRTMREERICRGPWTTI